MPISSFSAPSAIAKPGVVANAAARPASPYDGQVIYQQDTDQAYVWNGSAWVLLSTGTANPPGLELIKTVTVGSGVSTVSVTNVFSSTYENYRVLINTIDCSTEGLDFMIRFDGGGTTNYYSSTYYDLYDGTSTGFSRKNAAAAGGISLTGAVDNTSVSLDIYGPNLAKRTTYTSLWHVGWQGWAGGQSAVTTQYTDFTLLPGSGTMTGGTIRVYGYRN